VRTVLIAFALGAGALGIALLAASLALGIVAQSGGWPGFRVGVGSLTVLAFTRDAGRTSTTFGPGIAAVAMVGGAANATAAAWLRRRAG
jgi:hypothetical protein